MRYAIVFVALVLASGCVVYEAPVRPRTVYVAAPAGHPEAPAPIAEEMPPRTSNDAIYIRGHWRYMRRIEKRAGEPRREEDGWLWMPGRWVTPPEPGLVWRDGYWTRSGGAWRWVDPVWVTP